MQLSGISWCWCHFQIEHLSICNTYILSILCDTIKNSLFSYLSVCCLRLLNDLLTAMAFNSLGTIIWFIGTIINVLFYANKANAVCVCIKSFFLFACNILTQHCFVHFVNLEDEVKKFWHGCKKVLLLICFEKWTNQRMCCLCHCTFSWGFLRCHQLCCCCCSVFLLNVVFSEPRVKSFN